MSGAPAHPAIAAPAAPPAPTSSAVAPPEPRPPRAHSLAGHVRAGVAFLVLMVLVSGFAYPGLVTEIAHVIDPTGAGGSLIDYPNGTIEGSEYLAQNLSAGALGPYLFWERPSLTDYNTTLGAASPPGPTDPALQALLEEIINFTRYYGNLSNSTPLPFWWVSPSGSSLDPDLVAQGVLIQAPRVALANNLSLPFVQGFVNEHIVQPVLPDVGVPYVNVLELDIALLQYTGNPAW